MDDLSKFSGMTLIGKGNTADVFEIEGERVIKLFCAGYPESSARKEFKNSKLISKLNIPIAKSYDFIELNQRYGIIFDKIAGICLQDVFFQTYDIEKCISILAHAHRNMLCHALPKANSFHSILRHNIEYTDKLNAQRKSELYKIIDKLPDGDNFCHGDFHFGNVIMSQDKPYVIDYMNVCKGHEHCDIARTVYLIEFTPVPYDIENKKQFLQLKKQAADSYLKKMGVDREDILKWLIVISAARLAELNNEQSEETNTVLQFLSGWGL